MTTRNINPNLDGEGSIGEDTKRWNSLFVNFINGEPVSNLGVSTVIASNYAGNGSETIIPHGLGVEPAMASVVTKSNPDGYLGEVWVRKDATNVYIGNTGSHTGACDVIIEL